MRNVLLAWQDAFAVGHQTLDAEHEHLLCMINQIHEMQSGTGTSQQLLNLLNNLYVAAMEHFRHENALMRDIIAGAYLPPVGCGNISEAIVNEHCAEHANALIELEGMLQSFVPDQGAALANSLKDWFVDHATKHDAQLRAFFQVK